MGWQRPEKSAIRKEAGKYGPHTEYLGNKFGSVLGVNLMVKLLRAHVWMPWCDQAMKDAASGETLGKKQSIL